MEAEASVAEGEPSSWPEEAHVGVTCSQKQATLDLWLTFSRLCSADEIADAACAAAPSILPCLHSAALFLVAGNELIQGGTQGVRQRLPLNTGPIGRALLRSGPSSIVQHGSRAVVFLPLRPPKSTTMLTAGRRASHANGRVCEDLSPSLAVNLGVLVLIIAAPRRASKTPTAASSAKGAVDDPCALGEGSRRENRSRSILERLWVGARRVLPLSPEEDVHESAGITATTPHDAATGASTGGGPLGGRPLRATLRAWSSVPSIVFSRVSSVEASGGMKRGRRKRPLAELADLEEAGFSWEEESLLRTACAHIEVALARAREREAEHETLYPAQMLSSMLPAHVADQLKQRLYAPKQAGRDDAREFIVDASDEAVVLFSEVVDFERYCNEHAPDAVVRMLNTLFAAFDRLLANYAVYKVETVGSCYMVAAGLNFLKGTAPAATELAQLACDMLTTAEILDYTDADGDTAPVQIRLGMHTGPVLAGVVGLELPRYCLFGDTVNTASRMQSTAPPGHVQVSEAMHARLTRENAARFNVSDRGMIEVKGKGSMHTYLLKASRRRRSSLTAIRDVVTIARRNFAAALVATSLERSAANSQGGAGSESARSPQHLRRAD